MKKTIKKVLIIALVYSIGIGCVLAMCLRAEQINSHNETKNVSYIAHK